MSKGLFTTTAVALALSNTFAGAVAAQGFPEKPIQVIVPFAAGGQGDVMARLVIKRIEEMALLEQPMVVVNVPGGAATIGMRQAKAADADGYTLLYIHQTMMTSELMGTLDFSYTDMVPVAETNFSCLLTATAEGSGVANAQDWIDQAKADPGGVKEATLVGSIAHFTTAMFAKAADMKVGYVNAGGGADRIASILGNHTQTAVVVPTPVTRNPKLAGVVYYGEERHRDLPEVPTAKELGHDVISCLDNVWYAPAGTPEVVVEMLAGVFEQVTNDAAFVKAVEAKGDEAKFLAGHALDTHLAAIYEDLSAVAGELR
ncbi:Bug family tripartite tricarboxylate transporter substrate binding protein [Paracoccus homiensis]|uniref:Tripartite-type tricarboxylate transporter, receptor component TctC n=1 Tax=Paracoccus homiensis TaxID=364199 RepID=A0A1I0ISP7_9RHOB|nr:tripartite tricarboxylate transporter substrate binding protein [Paracoccus homiensis]SET99483.1 Tripartite-type tricarboxylate transporter, receptor component TctC [Paracoccus homiensis]